MHWHLLEGVFFEFLSEVHQIRKQQPVQILNLLSRWKVIGCFLLRFSRIVVMPLWKAVLVLQSMHFIRSLL